MSAASTSPTTVAAIAWLVLTVPLVGCADDRRGSGQPPAEGEAFTAREGLETARNAADEWSTGAELAGVTMAEQEEAPEEWNPSAFGYTGDESIGDGAIPQWLYFFVDGDEVHGVYVDQDGQLYEDPEPPGQTPQDPLAEWGIDSSDAADAAREDEDFAEILSADDAGVLYALQQGEEGPVWWVQARSEAMDDERAILVDAETGEARPFS